MMEVLSGASIRRTHRMRCDIAIVGSGPGGATVAAELAEAGLSVVVLEAGALFEAGALGRSTLDAMTTLYRDAGAQVTANYPSMPLVQGVAVGGTSVINGAISWRLPRDIWEEWVERDPGLRAVLRWDRLTAMHDRVEADLGIAPTAPEIAGRNNNLLALGADVLGLEHRPIRRNVTKCLGLGKCLEGCPKGRKASMVRTYLPRAVAAGAVVVSQARVDRVRVHQERAVGVQATTRGGARLRVDATVGVVVAASAIQTPVLLMRSGLRTGPVGENFQAHPGVAVIGRYPEPVAVWSGATQGHEVIGLRHEGLKFEALGYGRGMAYSRMPGVGVQLSATTADSEHWAHWGAAIRAQASGRVRPGLLGGARVDYRLTRDDLRRIRRGVSTLGELHFAAGAQRIAPHVHGWADIVKNRTDWTDFADRAPLSATAYSPAVTHMFGTCRMGSDPERSVVRPDFRHHATDGLWVSDSSVFPSNTGVNPQTSICAMARICADEIAKAA